jgi:hypothetical protein
MSELKLRPPKEKKEHGYEWLCSVCWSVDPRRTDLKVGHYTGKKQEQVRLCLGLTKNVFTHALKLRPLRRRKEHRQDCLGHIS